MTFLEAINERHSVRSYLDKPIPSEIVSLLNEYIKKCNEDSGLNVQLITNEPKAFNCFLSRYGKFNGVKNYLAIAANKHKYNYETIGYYGEKIVLYAQTLGLNTCWVALTYKKTKSVLKLNKGEKLHLVISIGYGKNQGKKRKSKAITDVCDSCTHPDWYIKGIESALLAPTAMNQQKFYFTRNGNKVKAKSGAGFYTKMDLGIVKLHFEIGAGKENFEWE
jgi:hypothetical protein